MPDFIKKHGDKLKIIIIVLGVLAVGWIVIRSIAGASGDVGRSTRQRVVICAETGEVFESFGISDGESMPYENPSTGNRTVFLAEKCFWTRDGKATLTPTYVLTNEIQGKPGATTCPDCGRRVVPHNPPPPPQLLQEALEREGKD